MQTCPEKLPEICPSEPPYSKQGGLKNSYRHNHTLDGVIFNNAPCMLALPQDVVRCSREEFSSIKGSFKEANMATGGRNRGPFGELPRQND